MIAQNIDNIDVLRRTLTEMDDSILKLVAPISGIDTLPANTADIVTIVAKVNELVMVVKAISVALNQTRNNQA